MKTFVPFFLCPSSIRFLSVHTKTLYAYTSSLALFIPSTFKMHEIRPDFQWYINTQNVLSQLTQLAYIRHNFLKQIKSVKEWAKWWVGKGWGGSVSAITINYKQYFLSFTRCCIDYPCTCCISSPFAHAVLLADLCVLLSVVLRVLG